MCVKKRPHTPPKMHREALRAHLKALERLPAGKWDISWEDEASIYPSPVFPPLPSGRAVSTEPCQTSVKKTLTFKALTFFFCVFGGHFLSSRVRHIGRFDGKLLLRVMHKRRGPARSGTLRVGNEGLLLAYRCACWPTGVSCGNGGKEGENSERAGD